MEKLIVSTSPHIHTKQTTQSIMRDVLIALAPAALASVILFGLKALLTIVLCVGTCMLSEFLFNVITKKKQPPQHPRRTSSFDSLVALPLVPATGLLRRIYLHRFGLCDFGGDYMVDET